MRYSQLLIASAIVIGSVGIASIFYARAAAQQTSDSRPEPVAAKNIQAWEYKIDDLGPGGIMGPLNKLGADGWELIFREDYGKDVRFWFKRPLRAQ